MLSEYLVKADVLNYFKSLPDDTIFGNPESRVECPLMTYLNSLDIAPVGSFSMDLRFIYTEYSTEEMPSWAIWFVRNATKKYDNFFARMPVADAIEVLEKVEVTYSFNELSEQVQQKVYNSYLNDIDFQDWASDKIAELEADLENETQGNDISIRYSGFSNQGDGASFTGTIHIGTFISDITGTESEYPLLMYVITNNDLYDDYVNVYRTNHHYVHACSVKVGDVSVSGNATDIADYLEEELGNLQTAMQEWVEERGNDIYAELEREYENIINFANFRENEMDIENRYTIDGELL